MLKKKKLNASDAAMRAAALDRPVTNIRVRRGVYVDRSDWAENEREARHFVRMQAIFFFQAEDGIRYHCVTGVQTCALPISDAPRVPAARRRRTGDRARRGR